MALQFYGNYLMEYKYIEVPMDTPLLSAILSMRAAANSVPIEITVKLEVDDWLDHICKKYGYTDWNHAYQNL